MKTDPIPADLKKFIAPAHEMAMDLRERIRSGNYTLGAALPTERDLCNKYNVSRWTVRQALQTLEREHLVVRQHGRGTFVVSSLDAAPPVNLRTGLIGLMVWEVEYGFTGLVQGTCNAAAERGYAVTTGSVHTFDEEAKAVRAMIRNDILGVVLTPRSAQTHTHSAQARSYYDEMLRQNIAVVLVDMLIDGCQEDHILIDNAHGTALSTGHVIGLGHQRIAYLTHNRFQGDDYPIGIERQRGFIDTCQRHGITPPQELIIQTDADHYRQQLQELLSRSDRPTAIICYNDLWAIRAIQVAREMGLKVPADLSVVGFDDSVMAPTYDVPLTTINPERYEMGVTAAELLIAKIERRKPRPTRGIRITPRLVLRQSTAPPPGA